MATLVLTEHFLPVRGGTITWLVQAYSRYKPAEVVVVAPKYADDRLVDRSLPFRVERIPMTLPDWDPSVPASMRRYGQILWHVRKMCYQHGVRQVHAMKVLPEGLVAWCLRSFSALPYLLYAHGEEILIGLTSRKLRWLLPRIYNGAAAIIANSRHTKTLLEDIGVQSEKIHIIHPGVDLGAFRVEDAAVQAMRRRHNLGHAPMLLTVGRLQRRKGQDMVIKALPYIAERIPEVKYVVIGMGEENAALQNLAQDFEVQERVVFAGQVPESDLPTYYAACDVFVMPNRQIGADIEGFGIAFLEAGAAGKPVIGGKSGGTEDAIEEGVTGLRIDGTSLEDIADAVITLLSNPVRAQAMGQYGRYRVPRLSLPGILWSNVPMRWRPW